MDSRESLAPSPSLHHHHRHLPPGMMMPLPPNSYNSTDHHHQQYPSHNSSIINDKIANLINPNSMQQRFPFNSSDQYGDGSAPTGFRASGYNLEPSKKKRGRPRKYSPPSDGNIALGLSPVSVNGVSSGNLENSNDGNGRTPIADSFIKKHRGRPAGSSKKQLDALGLSGVGFTPHVIVVKAGEDIASTMTSFAQQGPRTICILSANGAISNVTLRQPATSGGTVTYEGRFEIISLSGSFVHSESDGDHGKPSGLSVSLAGSDGRVLGGCVAGMLVAASPVQVIVGSFITDAKKSKSTVGPGPSPAAPPNMLTFDAGGGGGAGISPSLEGPSNESSDESGSSPLHTTPAAYNNATHQQRLSPPPMQNHPMYSNMGWPGSTMNMLPN